MFVAGRAVAATTPADATDSCVNSTDVTRRTIETAAPGRVTTAERTPNHRRGGARAGSRDSMCAGAHERGIGGRVMEPDRDETIDVLNEILELELAGAVRYMQYSL